MKRGIKLGAFLVLLIFFISSVSAEIIFTQSLKPTYNLGDTVFVPITIKTLTGISGVVEMNLVWNGTEINFYKNGINLISGAEKSLDSSLVLIRNIIGGSRNTCRVKVVIGSDYALSDEFKISDSLKINGILRETVFDSGMSIPITGKITRETGENANGFVEASIITNDINQNVTQIAPITNGLFAMNISLPSNLKAGNYFLNLNAYEKDSDGLFTNTGNINYNISVRQVPTNLEIIIENKEINPRELLKISAILHDQTGEQINVTTFITIKNFENKIIEQEEINAGANMEYPIAYNEPPAEWKVYATSNKLSAEETFLIKQKESVDIQIINKTILVTNNGNVLYNKTLLVKIGDTPMNIKVVLDIDESKKYVLTAPDGEYIVKIVADEEEEITGKMSLTGIAVGIRETSWSSFGIIFCWVLLISILVAGTFFGIRKIRKKSFFTHGSLNKKKDKEIPILKNNTINPTGNKAEMSLSIKGDKQDASVICLKIKDLRELRMKRGGSVNDTLQKITEKAEENNAVVYENQEYLFFIFAPIKTRTFKNEKLALNLTEEIQEMMKEHNRMFSQKMIFGISLNYGTIIAKVENGIFNFMSMDSLITLSKKIASLSEEEILLSNKMNDLVRLYTRTEKDVRDGMPVFILTNIKKEDDEAKRFINKFLNRQDKD
jgi:hypothetical protein